MILFEKSLKFEFVELNVQTEPVHFSLFGSLHNVGSFMANREPIQIEFRKSALVEQIRVYNAFEELRANEFECWFPTFQRGLEEEVIFEMNQMLTKLVQDSELVMQHFQLLLGSDFKKNVLQNLNIRQVSRFQNLESINLMLDFLTKGQKSQIWKLCNYQYTLEEVAFKLLKWGRGAGNAFIGDLGLLSIQKVILNESLDARDATTLVFGTRTWRMEEFFVLSFDDTLELDIPLLRALYTRLACMKRNVFQNVLLLRDTLGLAFPMVNKSFLKRFFAGV